MSKNKWNAVDYATHSGQQQKWARELINKLQLSGDEHLLDIGCGDGKITAELARAVPNGLVHGIDASREMIAFAQTTHAQQSNLEFLKMNATAINLTKTFDLAFSNAVLHWIENHKAVLRGVARVLTSDGRILFQMGGYGNAAGIVEVLNLLISQAEWRSYFKDFKCPYFFYHITDYEEWLPESGFRPLRIELIPKSMQHPNADGLKGWLRTTWFPYTDRLPEELREGFIDELVVNYLKAFPALADGSIQVEMVRLEVEAQKQQVFNL